MSWTLYGDDLFSGASGTLLTAHAPDSGGTWPTDSSHEAGGGALALDGSGMIYLGGTDSANIPSWTMPASPNFEVQCTFKRLSALATGSPGLGITLFAPYPSFATPYEFLYFENANSTLGTGFQFSGPVGAGGANASMGPVAAPPAVGALVYLRVRVTTTGGNTTFQASSSADGSTWTDLGITATIATPTQAIHIGPYGALGTGPAWSSTTGPHLGRLVVQDLSAASATLSGPASGTVSRQSTAFSVSLDQPAGYGGVTITPASSQAGDTFQATAGGGNVAAITIAQGASSGTFYLTPSSTAGDRSVSITTGPVLTYGGSPITYSAASAGPTTATLTGPTSGTAGSQSSAFTVTLNAAATSPVTITPASSQAGDTFQATAGGGNVAAITIAQGASSGTFYLTPSSTAGDRSVSITTGPVLTYGGSPITYSAASGSATSYTLVGPSGGVVDAASTLFIVTLNGLPAGVQTVTITPSGGGLSTPIVLTFSGSTTTLSFAITPTSVGTVTLTATSSPQLGTDPPALHYAAAAAATVWTYAATVDEFDPGLTTVGYRVLAHDGSTYTARTTEGVAEQVAGSGIYGADLTLPFSGRYRIIWDDGSGRYASETISPLVVDTTGLNAAQCLSILLAQAAGLSTGFGAAGAVAGQFLGADGATPRILAGAVDAFGNRSASTLNPPV